MTTPRAEELRGLIGEVMQSSVRALTPHHELKLAEIERTVTFRTSDGFVENFGPALVQRIAKEAPGIRLRFIPKMDKDPSSLREAKVDLETGVVGQDTGPEIRAQALFRDRFVGVVRKGHELSRGKITAARFASAHHVAFSRRGIPKGQIDLALAAKGLERQVATIVGSFSAALALARASDLVATVPERHTNALRSGLFSFALPVQIPGITVSLLWHPRLDADPVHKWIRKVSREICSGR